MWFNYEVLCTADSALFHVYALISMLPQLITLIFYGKILNVGNQHCIYVHTCEYMGELYMQISCKYMTGGEVELAQCDSLVYQLLIENWGDNTEMYSIYEACSFVISYRWFMDNSLGKACCGQHSISSIICFLDVSLWLYKHERNMS